ncbi:hypothetical protein DL546_001285 [Coniochaeta pulveracea]|uniref:Uncharacterized protein n=1 Tax=Coniochaeta pulveracea TaxID=177199 RepID=A0A420XW47_9PEZI|nr:hypothetical protein DL546_001285 [Coniochaeta pulveracea]
MEIDSSVDGRQDTTMKDVAIVDPTMGRDTGEGSHEVQVVQEAQDRNEEGEREEDRGFLTLTLSVEAETVASIAESVAKMETGNPDVALFGHSVWASEVRTVEHLSLGTIEARIWKGDTHLLC